MANDLLGRTLDAGDYVFNVNTRKTVRIIKVTRKFVQRYDWRTRTWDTNGAIRESVVVRGDNGNYAMSVKFCIKAVDANGTLSLEGLRTEQPKITSGISVATPGRTYTTN